MKGGALVLISIFIYLVAFCGCIDNSKDNGNTINKINEFKVVPADEATFKEFVSKSTAHSYEYYNILGGFNTASGRVKALPTAELGISADSNGVERHSETNVQVKSVDEADIVKTDGNYIYFTPPGSYHIIKNYPEYPHSFGVEKTYIIDALPPESAEIIKDISNGGVLYLCNDNLIIIDYNNDEILNYNVSNPKNPKLKWKMDLNGSYVDSRVHNGKLYLIVSKFDYIVCPIIWNGVKINYNKYYIPIVPDVISRDFDRTYIISSIDVNSGNIENTIATSGTYYTTTYMSKNNIYFTYHLIPNENILFINFLKENSNKYFPNSTAVLINKVLSSELFGDEAKYVEIRTILDAYFKTLPSEERMNLINKINKDYEIYLEEHWEELEKTGIMKIDINTFEVKSGSVPGRLINQFAMDEYNNNLRVATTIGNYWKFRDKMTNNLYILDDELNIKGKLTNLEKGERIYAVRFMGDTAYIITYKETDPLLVIGLKDPKNPKLLGELKIPGYSTYLHPIGNNRLIGIGKGDDRKLKISLFDVSDHTNPKEVDKYKLPEYWSPALYNHHAFLWDKDKNIMVIPVGAHVYMFKIENDKITMKKDDKHKSNVLRSLYINNYIYTFSNDEIHIIDENSWNTVKKIGLN
ncbi:beta-propeller domain-containing protein [Methanothermococcus sp. Ax23]|uniref:beta-propeller domain-containing protein n=1 Tax=Methanothermococcus sp. Ax23 TaxID=3156486 RepID=UPI003BA3AB39